MKYNLLLGGNRLNSGIAQKMSLNKEELFVCDHKSNMTRLGRFVEIDVLDEEFLDKVEHFLPLKSCNFATTSIDLAVPNLTRIMKRNNFCFFERSLVPIAKNEMTSTWASLGLLNRKSELLTSEEEIISKSKSFQFPIIIKPNLGSSSLGISIIKTWDEFRQAYSKASDHSKDKNVVIEEFITGIEFTVELIADQFGNVNILGISQKHHSMYLDDNKVATALLYGWTSLSAAKYAELTEIGRQCFKAFNPYSTLGHLEIVYDFNRDCFTPIEIGFRSSGFISSHLIGLATGGKQIIDFEMAMRLGEKIKNIEFSPINVAIYYFVDAPPGVTLQIQRSITDYIPFSKSFYRFYYDDRLLRTEKLVSDNARLGIEVIQTEKEFGLNQLLKAESDLINDSRSKS